LEKARLALAETDEVFEQELVLHSFDDERSFHRLQAPQVPAPAIPSVDVCLVCEPSITRREFLFERSETPPFALPKKWKSNRIPLTGWSVDLENRFADFVVKAKTPEKESSAMTKNVYFFSVSDVTFEDKGSLRTFRTVKVPKPRPDVVIEPFLSFDALLSGMSRIDSFANMDTKTWKRRQITLIGLLTRFFTVDLSLEFLDFSRIPSLVTEQTFIEKSDVVYPSVDLELAFAVPPTTVVWKDFVEIPPVKIPEFSVDLCLDLSCQEFLSAFEGPTHVVHEKVKSMPVDLDISAEFGFLAKESWRLYEFYKEKPRESMPSLPVPHLTLDLPQLRFPQEEPISIPVSSPLDDLTYSIDLSFAGLEIGGGLFRGQSSDASMIVQARKSRLLRWIPWSVELELACEFGFLLSNAALSVFEPSFASQVELGETSLNLLPWRQTCRNAFGSFGPVFKPRRRRMASGFVLALNESDLLQDLTLCGQENVLRAWSDRTERLSLFKVVLTRSDVVFEAKHGVSSELLKVWERPLHPTKPTMPHIALDLSLNLSPAKLSMFCSFEKRARGVNRSVSVEIPLSLP
jgi:hypothetical protein